MDNLEFLTYSTFIFRDSLVTVLSVADDAFTTLWLCGFFFVGCLVSVELCIYNGCVCKCKRLFVFVCLHVAPLWL